MDPIFLTGGIVAGFAVGMGAGILLERYRMNTLIKASFRHVPGFPHRIAIIKEQHVHQAQCQAYEPRGPKVDLRAHPVIGVYPKFERYPRR